MRQYEITYLISDEISDSEITKVSGKVNDLIASADGKILKDVNLGRRKLAYPINKQNFATYVVINFELDSEKLNQLKKEMNAQNEIVRLLAILKDFKKEELILTADDIADSKEIEKVVGGEKSFEAIKGRTDESYGLMTKRSEEMPNEPIEEEPALEDEKKVKDTTKPEPKAKKNSTKKVEKESISKDLGSDEEKPDKKATVKKQAVQKKETKFEKSDNEADRLAKLDKELDDLLGDDL